MSFFREIGDFFDDLRNRLRGENEERRREDRALEEMNLSFPSDSGNDSDVPRLLKVDLQSKDNALTSNCERFELVSRGKGTLVIRRGATFAFKVVLNQKVDLKQKHFLKLYFNFGPRPLVSKGTQEVIEVSGKKFFDKPREEWDCRVVDVDNETVLLEISVPNDVPVGIWSLALELRFLKGGDPSYRNFLRVHSHLYILFNPWSKYDDVYLDDDKKRKEYVLEDVGKIWVGGTSSSRGRQWVFGQFDDAVLPACILLLEKSGLRPEQRGDPVLVSRAISKMVNSNDDSGVIVGRWDEKYNDGIAPSAWTGSISILEKYMQSGRGVKYGQCWVFSGVTTTICRALGIPCRSVSNLNSAHDTNMSLTIDKYFDKSGEELKNRIGDLPGGIDDSIWNFHVWNDVWMSRPDLPSGFGGWQAIDATPQERSHGVFQCGPASLEAVRRGQTNLNYDINFVLAEVNADVVRWQTDENAKDGFRKLSSNKTYIGSQLLTKKPGKMANDSYLSSDREDCTSDYKAPEGTRAERVTLHSAARRTRAARHAFRFPSIAEEDIEFSLIDIERVSIGDDFAITVKAKNTSDSSRSIALVITASSEYYNGVKAHVIKKAEGNFTLGAGETQTLNMKVPFQDYFDKLVEYAMIKTTAIANVTETTQTWIDEDTLQIIKPSIRIKVFGQAAVGKPLRVRFSFKNPMDIALKRCSIIIDGPGLTRPKTIRISDVGPADEMTYELEIFPKSTGSKSLVVTFNSSQLVDITGSTLIEVE